ncbi:acetylornithine deacetylase [Legionella oakridgensis]|uniref:Probable succinyl-diaminopimelate desuccinylase n=2 Tax=Legionella oakridgensis TaxID=29423 RepID=W0BE25_9GAMM|nr:acetylornithine deacetylase [Legionella oakridgensis]AHE66956.1 acetylornithine deacetylase [Legionella oakridgensis ATCC 33761 = DSM 21215]KTD39522.1 acetylornithine deacetylase [Legionella oakridgensis]STY20060.1 acetylornithine deacetylase [Legionella longbeachae]
MTVIKPGYKELLAKFIAFNTVSSQSNLPFIDCLATYLQQHQFETNYYYNEDKSKANLIAVIGPKDERGILLSGHTDVVPVAEQHWYASPFQLIEKDNRLIGRGTADMKGFLAVVCDVVGTMDLNRLKKPLYLVFTYDEEIGCFGAKALQKKLAELATSIEFALIGEPTNYTLVNAHKSLQATRTEFVGQPAHSSCPHLGHSAIMAAADFLQKLPSVMPMEEDKRFNPSRTTFNAGSIHGGNALNIIAEHCQIDWECRPLPQINIQQINKSVESMSQIIRTCSQVEIKNHVISFVPGLTASGNQTAIQILQQFLPEGIKVTTVPFVTEAGLFQQASIPTVVFGPGEIEQAHQPNESICIDALERYRQFLVDLIAYYCH